MQAKHQSLIELWSEWHGTGAYLDSEGGIAGCNKKYGKKWQTHLPKAHYSRTACVIQAIESFAATNNMSKEDAIQPLSPITWSAARVLPILCASFSRLDFLTRKDHKEDQRRHQCRLIQIKFDAFIKSYFFSISLTFSSSFCSAIVRCAISSFKDSYWV
jgi:hypothetical protein